MLLPVWVLLDGRTPVAGAQVAVYAGSPPRLAKAPLAPLNPAGATTNTAGTATLNFARLPRTFTVIVRGGGALGRASNGTMSVQVHGYSTGTPVHGLTAAPVVHVNPVTTLVDLLQQADRRVGEARAERLIDHALQIPSWVDGITLSVDNQGSTAVGSSRTSAPTARLIAPSDC